MSFVERGGLRMFAFDSLRAAGVTQAIFTRRGGVSPEPWASLNLGGTVGDERDHVVENRRRCFAAVDRPVESVFDVWQVHSADVRFGEAPRPLHEPHVKADIILTDRPEVTLMMRFADCVPVFVVDPVRRVVGMAHAGWRGTMQRAAAVMVGALCGRYGSRPRDLLAAIGPSICRRHYAVGGEVAAETRRVFGTHAEQLLCQENGQVTLDLWEANRLTLRQAGVEQIDVAAICTAEHPEDWYSHRGEHGRTGRFGAILALD